MDSLTRRHVLGCIAGASALAGCTTNSTTSTQFNQVTTDGTSLVIELDSADGVDELSVIDPNGAAFTTVDATAGQTRYTVEIGTEYPPGEYEVNTVADEEVSATTAVDIRPDVEITDAGVGENHPEKVPNGLSFPDTQLMVSAQNTGTGPEAITGLEITGDIPNPVTHENQDKSGIFDNDNGYGEVNAIVIGAGESVLFFSSTHPFGKRTNSCQGGDFEIDISTRVSDENVSKRYKIRYQGGSQDDCRISIEEGQ